MRPFAIRFHGSSSIPIASFVEHLFIKTFCYLKYLNRRIVYNSGHQGTFNPAVITNKEAHMVDDNINTNDETSHTTSNAKKRSLKISDYFTKKKMEHLLYLVSKLRNVSAILSEPAIFSEFRSFFHPPKMCETINSTSEV